MTLRFITAEARAGLRKLKSGVAQLCVTSPPYYGKRDYGTARWVGGDPRCHHGTDKKWLLKNSTQRNGTTGGKRHQENAYAAKRFKVACHLCGARREDLQIGLEATPEEYIEKIVAVFREVWRVLADDGLLYVILGDTYAGSGGAGGVASTGLWRDGRSEESRLKVATGVRARQPGAKKSTVPPGLKAKDRFLIPARVALALQADGWYLRDEIIWNKPAPMPSSAKDRTTMAHEHIYMLSKRSIYYYDAAAIAEPSVYAPGCGWDEEKKGTRNGKRGAVQKRRIDPEQSFRAIREMRNKRSVWTVRSQPYQGEHFATFPPELIEPCILAGSAPGDTVVDPFGGVGTTAAVCQSLRRNAISIDLNPKYTAIAKRRAGRDAHA